MRGWVSILLVTAALLGGCAGPDRDPSCGEPGAAPCEDADAADDTPQLLCHDERCNFEMTLDEGRQGNEVTIAVNPLDPRNIVGGAKDYYPPDAGDCVWDGVYVTHDGGRTYEDRSFDGSPWRQRNDPDPSKVNYATQFWCTTDPVVYFSTSGTFYYLLMAYQADPVTGSKTGEDTELGGFNDWAFNRAVQIVAISDDGGDTFHTLSPVLEGSYPVAFHDKGWIAADAEGTIHIGWLAFVEGNVYFRSADGGRTWQEAELMAPFASPDDDRIEGAGQGTFVDVGPGAEVYYSWAGSGGIALRRSTDRGVTWDEARIVVETQDSKDPGGLSPRDRRGGFPALATDRFPDSPFSGNVYFAWQDGRDDGNDIYFAASNDGGETFSTPIRINDDETTHAQFFPAISVSPGGVIDVSWMDRRDDGEDYLVDQYYAYSRDGGKTWSDNFRVRDAEGNGWDPALSHHQNGMIFVGDYNDIDSSWQAAHPVWPDTRSGTGVDVYTATILRPMFADGWDEDKKAAALEWIEAHPVA